MNFASATSIASILLCIAVLVQSVRLMRALEAVKGGGLGQIVGSVDTATAEARRVLGRLTELLRGDLAMTARTLQEGKAMVDELTVMTGIADAIAERIVAAAGATNRGAAVPDAVGDAPVSADLAAELVTAVREAAAEAIVVPPLVETPAPHVPKLAEVTQAPKRVAVPTAPLNVRRGDLPPGSSVAANRAGSRMSRRLQARIEADRAQAAEAGVAA
jgi:hypothetical protein